MLAKRRALTLGNTELQRTPVLLPSFSSKGFPDIAKIVQTTEEVIDAPILISAYDLHYNYNEIVPPFDFPSLIFLDSGGYESSKDSELSDFGERDYKARPWTKEMHQAVIANWRPSVPTVLISYDHPKERIAVRDQIERARNLTAGHTDVLREILLKPETEAQTLLQIDSVLPQVHALADFDVIGVTEKEIGSSIFDRMENIAKLRLALDKVGLETPIHVFGSLDAISSPLYFLAGADIFDGLTWLRFAFHDGYTIYKHNFGALQFGIKAKSHIIDGRTWFSNYRYLAELELEMRRFLKDYDFACFQYHSQLFQQAHDSVVEAVKA